ncbi:hypothetical protein KJ815_04605, partial [bacterium]|nr:hypothetical protein [bacterium]
MLCKTDEVLPDCPNSREPAGMCRSEISVARKSVGRHARRKIRPRESNLQRLCGTPPWGKGDVPFWANESAIGLAKILNFPPKVNSQKAILISAKTPTAVGVFDFSVAKRRKKDASKRAKPDEWQEPHPVRNSPANRPIPRSTGSGRSSADVEEEKPHEH